MTAVFILNFWHLQVVLNCVPWHWNAKFNAKVSSISWKRHYCYKLWKRYGRRRIWKSPNCFVRQFSQLFSKFWLYHWNSIEHHKVIQWANIRSSLKMFSLRQLPMLLIQKSAPVGTETETRRLVSDTILTWLYRCRRHSRFI